MGLTRPFDCSWVSSSWQRITSCDLADSGPPVVSDLRIHCPAVSYSTRVIKLLTILLPYYRMTRNLVIGCVVFTTYATTEDGHRLSQL